MGRSWLKPCSVRKMSVAEAAWLAGFIDGEGSICWYMSGRKKNSRTCFITAPNTHMGSLEKCRTITGAGSIVNKYEAGPRLKASYTWSVRSQRDVAEICRQIAPYLVIKTALAVEAVEWFESLDGFADLPGRSSDVTSSAA